MDVLNDFFNWAWARHHNPLSWYIRPLVVLPFCYFAYKRSIWGVALTLVAVTSSMFWFPAPAAADPRVTAFLAMERQYVTGPTTVGKAAMTMLVPLWLIVLAWSFWRRSWPGGFIVISVGTLLKIGWSFYFGGESAWAIIPPVALGFIVCAGILLYAFRRVRHGVEDRLKASGSRRADLAIPASGHDCAQLTPRSAGRAWQSAARAALDAAPDVRELEPAGCPRDVPPESIPCPSCGPSNHDKGLGPQIHQQGGAGESGIRTRRNGPRYQQAICQLLTRHPEITWRR